MEIVWQFRSPNGEDLRPLPLVERKKRLRRLLRRRSNHLIAEALAIEGRGKELFAAVEQHDLEGIVAKRKADSYRRGVKWWKVLNRGYSQAEGRHELFNGDAPHQSPDATSRDMLPR
jgi:ATP-dependent DNA ligase